MEVKEAAALVSRMLGRRNLREPKWRELSRWVCPQRGRFHDMTSAGRDAASERILFTHAASQAVLKGASGITSGMTPSNTSWFKPCYADPQMAEASGARAWLDEIDKAMKNCLENGSFYQAIQSFNMDLLWAGCALLYSEKADHNPLQFECVQIGTFAVETDRRGQLLAVARRMTFTVEELAREFGRDALSPRTAQLLEKSPRDTVYVWHLVRLTDKGRFTVSSQFWEEDYQQNFLREHGYNEMPFFFTVWHESDTPYGTGPGDSALPDAMQMDTLERRKLDGIGKITHPPLVADSTLKGHVNLGPDQITYAEQRAQLTPILDMQPFAAFFGNLLHEIATVNQRLEQALYAAVFSSIPLDQRPRDMSATEFMERKREAMQQLGPVMQAYTPNVLTPLLYRTVQTLDRKVLLPPPPESLAGYDALVRMEFTGPMVNALRQTDGQAITALLQSLGQIAQITQNTGVFDKLNVDQMADEYATALAAPGSVLLSDEEVARLREQKQQMQAMQMQMQMAMQQSQMNQMDAQALNQQAQAGAAMAQTPDTGAGLFEGVD